jgi:RNA polymerase sigma factor (TIGR02999 family)
MGLIEYAGSNLPARITADAESMENGDSIAPERITDLFASWREGNAGAGDRLFATLYQELRRLARYQLRGRPAGATLDTTALIHEVYLKLAEGARAPVRDRGHFLALASRVMRQIVVDHARQKSAAKRDAAVRRPFDENGRAAALSAEDLLALDEALNRLESLDPRLAQLIDLRFFGGLSVEETAEALDLSEATIKRDWLKARAFLLHQMERGGP